MSTAVPAASFQNIPHVTGHVGAFVSGMNGDGTVVASTSDIDGSHYQPYRWDAVNGIVVLPLLPGAVTQDARAYNISRDGSVVVGTSANASNEYQAVRWDGASVTALPHLAGRTYSVAWGVNEDATIIAGVSFAGITYTATYWDASNTAYSLGTLAGDTDSWSFWTNADGSKIVGWSADSTGVVNVYNSMEAVLWDNGVATGLGHLSGTTHSGAFSISADGNVIVGSSGDGNGNDEAFRWDSVNGMTGLGFLPGGTVSQALATNYDGSVIGGYAFTASDDDGFIWTAADGMRGVSDILTAGGVDLSGWNISNVYAVSDDGQIVAGNALDSSNASFVYIANIATPGVTTPGAVSQSLQSVAQSTQQVTQTAANTLNQSLFAARNLSGLSAPIYTRPSTRADADAFAFLSPAAGGALSKLSLYSLGGFGIGQNNDFSSHDGNGTIGLSYALRDDARIGLGMIAAGSRTDLNFEGSSKLEGRGVSALLSYIPETGWRVYGTAFAAKLDVEITRGYASGAGLSFSDGDTDGTAVGGALQVGYAVPVADKQTIMPYAELRAAKTKLDGYTETGGPFPATFSGQDGENLSSRLGAQVDYKATDRISFTLRGAWAHRFQDDGTVSATSAGVTQVLGAQPGDKNWAEAAIGTGIHINDAAYVYGELGGRSGDTQDPAVNATLGMSLRF